MRDFLRLRAYLADKFPFFVLVLRDLRGGIFHFAGGQFVYGGSQFLKAHSAKPVTGYYRHAQELGELFAIHVYTLFLGYIEFI